MNFYACSIPGIGPQWTKARGPTDLADLPSEYARFGQNFKPREVLSSSLANIGTYLSRLAKKLTHLDKHVFMLRVPNNEGALPILFTLHELKAT